MRETMTRYYRKVIRITAEDSPNVRYALNEIKAGKEPSGKVILPGVLPWNEFVKRRDTWDEVRKCVSLYAQFYEGAEVLLYPPEWLNRAERIAQDLENGVGLPGGNRYGRKVKGIGIDPAEGGDKTSMSAVDELGLIEQTSRKTPNTADITAEAIAFMIRHNIPKEDSSICVFDRGGGGKQHADRLREQGYPVRTVAFGETIGLEPKRGMIILHEKIEVREERYSYKNRRAEMYGNLRILLDPSNERGFGIPRRYEELRRQLSPIPLLYDPEGRLRLLPKQRRDPTSTEKTLTDLIGCSPDEADSLVLAIWAMLNKATRRTAGGF